MHKRLLACLCLYKFHMSIYGHKKEGCLVQNISIGSFHASFHNFYNVSIYVKLPQKLVMKLKRWLRRFQLS